MGVPQIKSVNVQLAYVLFVILLQAVHVTNPVVVMDALMQSLIAVGTVVKIALPAAAIPLNAVLIVYVIAMQ